MLERRLVRWFWRKVLLFVDVGGQNRMVTPEVLVKCSETFQYHGVQYLQRSYKKQQRYRAPLN